MHGSYRRAFGPESVVELHKNIGIQHEDYLKQDDADKKADALRYMAGYVVQYLHLVPQEKKFHFKQTERVLHNSAMNIAEFDPREGSIAFCNLAKYAENLLEQPWRKDFHVIKLTSGFYVHNIAAQLSNAQEILIVMGYVNTDDTTLKLIPNQNWSNLKAVSRDCYVASQECLILSQIWQHVADQEPDYPLTIGEVFEYRKNHLGDTDTICNKLLYDIRARMHAEKTRQQLKQLHYQSQTPLKNTQRFVPVDRLIDFDGGGDDAHPGAILHPADEPDRPHPHHSFIPEREVERVQEQLKNVNVYNYNNDDEHIYDPVYGGDIPSIPVHAYQRKLSQGAGLQKPANNVAPVPQQQPPYFYNNNSRKSVPVVPSYSQPPPQYHHNNFSSGTSNPLLMYASDRNSVSPMIPKTVTSLFQNQTGSRNNVSKSNSMNSINGRSSSSGSMSHNLANQPPLTRSKVKETDLDAEVVMISPRESGGPYYNGSLRARKSLPAAVPIPQTNQQQQVPMYPDQFYPAGIVKPVAVYGSSQNAPGYYQRQRLHSDNSEEVLNDALAYAMEVGQLPKGQTLTTRPGAQQGYQHQATPIPPVQGSESESEKNGRNPGGQREPERGISHAGRSGSSTDASSSWDGSVREVEYAGGRHLQATGHRKSEAVKRPSHIELRSNQIRHADSSPESDMGQVQPPQQIQQQSRNKNGYRELSSSSSGGASPASPGSRNYPRNEELSSLDTVYYDYLLKQGQTDQVLSGGAGSGGEGGRSSKSNLNHSQELNTQRRPGSSSRSASSQHHPQNNYQEQEGDHIYDGRRVVPKRQNDTVSRKKQNPVESTIPPVGGGKSDPNYNLLASGAEHKPSHDKHLRKSSNPGTRGRDRERVPGEAEDPSVSAAASPPPKQPVEPWDCRFCTFRNLVEERICEVCAKSKDFFEDVEPQPAPVPVAVPVLVPLQPKLYSVPNVVNTVAPVGIGNNGAVGGGAVGGEEEEEKECPQCTLLNPVRARVCDACNFRLRPAESPKNVQAFDAFDNR